MLTIHALRAGNQVILSGEEFALLIRKITEIRPVEVMEKTLDDIETEEDRRAYFEAMQEFERGETVAFDEVKSSWL